MDCITAWAIAELAFHLLSAIPGPNCQYAPPRQPPIRQRIQSSCPMVTIDYCIRTSFAWSYEHERMLGALSIIVRQMIS